MLSTVAATQEEVNKWLFISTSYFYQQLLYVRNCGRFWVLQNDADRHDPSPHRAYALIGGTDGQPLGQVTSAVDGKADVLEQHRGGGQPTWPWQCWAVVGAGTEAVSRPEVWRVGKSGWWEGARPIGETANSSAWLELVMGLEKMGLNNDEKRQVWRGLQGLNHQELFGAMLGSLKTPWRGGVFSRGVACLH